MKILNQIGIILGICLLGELASITLPIPFPASVLSLVILLLLLLTGVVKLAHIEEISGFLLKNMPFFFIPAGLGIMEDFGVIRDSLPALVIICLLTTVLTFGVTALTVKAVIRLQGKREKAAS